MELEKIKTNRYVWHVASMASYLTIREFGLLNWDDSINRVYAHQYLRHPMGLYPFVFDGFFTATIEDELSICLVRIDTHQLKKQWYLDPSRFEIEWTSEDGYWSHHNLHQYVCVEGRVPPEVLDFYAYSLERERPELQIWENNGVTHVVAEPYGQEFVSIDKYVLYLKKLNNLEDLKLCA
jgi:hypothetical protein